jgi:hypothetical protein
MSQPVANLPSQPSPMQHAAAPAAVAIAGVQLQPGEFPIAVEKPGHVLWMFVILFGIFVVTLPVAFWFWSRAGRLYVVTNRRCIRIARNGSVQELPHAALDRFDIKKDLGYPSTIVLVPAQGSGHARLLFAGCGGFTESTPFSRLWGILEFWVRNQGVNIDEAPAVDAEGQIVGPGPGEGILLVQSDEGLCIFTPTHLIRIGQQMSRHTSRSITFHPTVPAYGYVLSLARRCGTPVELEQHLQAAFSQGILEQKSRHAFHQLTNAKLSVGSLMFNDGSQKGLVLVSIPRAQTDAVRTHLQRAGIQI